MQTVGLNVILVADFDSAEEAMAKFRQSVDRLAAETAKAFSNMAGTAAQIGNSFKPVSDGARNATQIVINESKARQQIDREETQAALNASRLKIQAQREESAAQRAATQAKRQEKDLYGQLVAENQALTRAYYNEAAAAHIAGDASEETANKLKLMAAAALEGNERLKSIEAGAGRFQRNVGNYSGATAYLQQSIAQLSGEIPNFFQSMRIGFMSIGNNIQPISLAIKQLRAENAQLLAQGKQTVPVLSSVIKSFLGWQTILLVGVGIISRYGGELIDWATGAGKAKAAAEALKKQQDELNQIQESANKTAGTQIAKLEVLNSTMTDGNLTMSKRVAAYNEAKKLYPSYLDNLTQDKALNEGIAKIIDTQLVPAIIAAAQARAYEGKISVLASQNIELAEKKKLAAYEKNRKETDLLIAKDKARANGNDYTVTPTGGVVRTAGNTELSLAAKAYQEASKAVQDFDDQITNNSAHIQALANDAKTAIQATGALGTDGIDPLTHKTKQSKEKVDALVKSSNNLKAEFAEINAKLAAGVITQFDALKEKAKALQSNLDSLFKNGGTQAAIQENINLLKRFRFEMEGLVKIDLNAAKGNNLFGGSAQSELHQYLQGLEEAKKHAKELSSGFYNALGIQDPRDSMKRRDVYSQFEDMGLDPSQYIDSRSTPKEQAEEGEDALKGLRKEYSRLERTASKSLGRPVDSFVDAIFTGKNAMDALGNSIKGIVSELVAAIAKAAIFNAIISAINPAAGAAGGGFLGILGKLIPFASGGVVTGPTPALVGEAGPEAIIPLNKLGSLMSIQKVQVSITGKTRGKDLVYTGNNYNTYVAR